MKCFIIFTCTVFCFGLITTAQGTIQIQDPPKYGFYYYLDAKSNSLVLLERATPSTKSKGKVLGFGGFDVSVEIKGGTSTIRFPSNQELAFYVRLLPNYNFAELAGAAQLIKTDVKGNKRLISFSSIGRDGKSSNSPFEPNPNSLAYKVEKYTSETFKVTPAKVLEPGEYCFNGLGTPDHFCFGIDPPSQQ